MAIDVIIPDSLKETYDTLHYAPAVRAGDLIFLSGVIAALKEGETGTEAEYVAAAEQAFAEMEMILKEAGASMADVVDVTSFHVDYAKHLGPLMAVKERYFPAPYPAWTLIGTTELFNPLGFVELKATAYAPR